MTTSTTENKPSAYRPPQPKGPNWGLLLIIALVVHAVGIGALAQFGFFDSTLEINKEEAREMAEQAEQRARERRERERKLKQDRKLREEDRADIERHEREVARQQILQYLEELQRVDAEMEELKELTLEGIEQRDIDQYRLYLAQEIERQSDSLFRSLHSYRHPDYQRYARTSERHQTREPMQELMRAAQDVLGDINDQAKIDEIVKQAELNVGNMKKLVEAAPKDRREAELEAQERGNLINRLTREFAGLEQLDPEEFRDVSAARDDDAQKVQVPEDLPALTPEELLELAKQLEEQINANFDDLRAGRLAQQMNLPLAEAMENLNPGEMPQREMPEFPMDPATFAELQKLQEALQDAANMAGQMASGANQKLQSAMGAGMMPGMGQQPGQMPGMGQQPGQMPGMGGGMGSNPFSMGMSMGGKPGRLNLKQNLDLTPPKDPRLSGDGEDDTAGNQKHGGQGMIAGTALPDVDLSSREQFIHAQSLPGHRFSNSSERSGWVYLNTFYTIGPWENHGRIDWSQLHGPDPNPFMNIDLDAVYTGGKRRGRVPGTSPYAGMPNQTSELDGKLRWRFVQTDSIRMTFPDEVEDGTYYAYTEVYFEEDMDMDVLVASDDATTAWISNSHPAYAGAGNCFKFHTEDELSSWKLGESRKRLRFTKGINRLLIRLENGPQFARLSVLLSPIGAISE